MKNVHISDYDSYIKESRNEQYILLLTFTDSKEFTKAVSFFNGESSFVSDVANFEFSSLSFTCTSKNDIDSLENEINTELIENGFDNYYFESE